MIGPRSDKKVGTVVCIVKSKPVILNWIQLLTPHPVIKLSDKNLASPDVRPSGPIDFCELVKETSTKGSILQLSELIFGGSRVTGIDIRFLPVV